MKYVGIDLGTTNSVICTYDGVDVQLYKSPDQNDVTPSAIFIDNRGNRYVGKRAYNNAAQKPDNAAILFKRLIGTSTPIKLPAVKLTMSPEECSAEILRVLYSYLPEEVRNSDETGTVITVPAPPLVGLKPAINGIPLASAALTIAAEVVVIPPKDVKVSAPPTGNTPPVLASAGILTKSTPLTKRKLAFVPAMDEAPERPAFFDAPFPVLTTPTTPLQVPSSSTAPPRHSMPS